MVIMNFLLGLLGMFSEIMQYYADDRCCASIVILFEILFRHL